MAMFHPRIPRPFNSQLLVPVPFLPILLPLRLIPNNRPTPHTHHLHLLTLKHALIHILLRPQPLRNNFSLLLLLLLLLLLTPLNLLSLNQSTSRTTNRRRTHRPNKRQRASHRNTLNNSQRTPSGNGTACLYPSEKTSSDGPGSGNAEDAAKDDGGGDGRDNRGACSTSNSVYPRIRCYKRCDQSSKYGRGYDSRRLLDSPMLDGGDRESV
ncbi:hypothetical protein CYLTODRAFT_105399 [Cylindrobasidium torrendii FP15055 ss-10]|uniref:Uncharacterized protein n=1 Tax=Cylindrobasidium torrendii FP15055 ss-10 TaxID=1314674 RepID=A0A0D7B4A8_9AGAR|nr:hypothetical protein CYLTODRAFT_105399 [Cylindrobasidium torrendii FP15055 ss-10]